MSELAILAPIPLPALPTITTRVATMDDLPFVDALQKKHSKQLGFFPRAQIEGYIKNGWMRVAEEVGRCELVVGKNAEASSSLSTTHSQLSTSPVGYLAFRDRYLKRDELGAVFQLCVEPGRRRGLIGATLLQSAFDASAYGCKLFCCWCAQDLEANRFWEAMGFQAIAYRKGSEKKARLHLFWQKRIRAGDTTTPWWFPSSTSGGAIGAGRIVLPIEPGTHWRDVRAITLPGEETKALPAPRATKTRAKAIVPVRSETKAPCGLWFATPTPAAAPAAIVVAREKPAKKAIDPRLIAASRELRDRWLERLNQAPATTGGKYDVARAIGSQDVVGGDAVTTRLLAA